MQKATNIYKTAAVAILLLLIIQIALAITQGVFNGALGDPDVYMWLNRVLQIHETGDWQNHGLARVDPPTGYEQHWTRPFDALLFSGAWMGSLVTDFGNSLYVWSALISPLLEVIAVLTLLWALSPLLNKSESEMLGFLFVTQVVVLATFVAGRADHQSLIFLFFITELGLGLRILMGSLNISLCIGAGLVSALAIWVSIESIIFSLATIISLGVFWLLGEKDMERKLFYYSVSIFLLLIPLRIIEYGWTRLFEPVFDQLSIAYIVLFGIISAYWFLIYYCFAANLENNYPLRRFGIAISGATTTAVVLYIFFPGIFSDPMGNTDELFKSIHLERISELQPALAINQINSSNWMQLTARFLFWLGITIPGISALAYLVKKNSGSKRMAWIYFLIFTLIYFPLACKEIRWAPYVVILMLPSYTWLVVNIIQWVGHKVKEAFAGFLRIMILAASVVVFFLPALLLGDIERSKASQACPLIEISSFLNKSDLWENKIKNILAFTDFGPELLYRTRHSVLSIPSHRPHAGYVDSYNIMAALDDGQALQIIKRRHVELILVCPNGVETSIYALKDEGEIFHQRLIRGNAPSWLAEVSLPIELAENFKLYVVDAVAEKKYYQ